MALKVFNQATDLALKAVTGKTAALGWTLRLFSNNHTPAHTDTEADYTEVTGGGYAGIALVAASWSSTPGDPSTITYPIQNFTFTGAIGGSGQVYGYYITDANGKAIFAELLATPFTIGAGYIVAVTLNLSCASVS